MKSNIKVKNEYPCLKIYTPITKNASDFIILFSQPAMGTVVNSDGNMYEIGYHTDEWNEDDFKMFDGQIILEN